jgi:transposase
MQKFKTVNNEQLFLLPPSIEDFIPSDHLARVINEVVETIDVTEIEAKYSHLGQKSYPPHLLLKLLFYGYSIGIRSGRKIAAACESDTAFMYLSCMYKPDFRTINDFRKSNIDFIEKAFVHIVKLCKELGMCKAGMLIIDSTKLKANACAERSKNKAEYQQWLEHINADIKNILDEAEQTDKKEDEQYAEKRGDELPEALCSKQKLKEKIKQVLEQMNDEKERINLTDKEVKFIKNKGKLDLHYSCQTAISEDGVIVSAYTNNCASDRTSTITLLNNAEQTTHDVYEEILADSGYATFDNYEELNNRNKVIYIPDQQINDEIEKQSNPYHRNQFIYNKEKNCFTCPENKELPFYANTINKKTKQQSKVYRCNDCPTCDQQSKCCTKGAYRQIHVEKREPIRKQIRERLNSIEGKLKYLKRMRIESVFGNIKYNLNYIHLYLRGVEKTTAEWQLICIGHNLKKLHKAKLLRSLT